MKRTQRGFTIVEILLVILVVVIVGFGGYYVWHTQHDKNSKTTNSTSAANSASTPSPTSTQKYFTIKEWSIRAPYEGSLSLEYALSANGNPQYASFSSIQLDTSDSQCASGANYGGIIDRYLSTDEYFIGDGGMDSGQTAAQYAATLNKSDYGHVGNYYYFYSHPQAACSASQSSQDLQNQTQDAVKALLPNLQTIPQ